MEVRTLRHRAARPLPPRFSAAAGFIALGGLLGLLPALRPAPACAQSGQFLVNDDPAGEEDRIDPVAVRLEDGNLFVLWLDNARGQLDLLARRFRPDLTPVDEPAMINDDGANFDQSALAVSAAAGGRFAAVWIDERRSPVAVCAQIFSAEDGTPIGGNIELTVDRASGLRERPVVATDARGYSLVCWEEGTFGLRRLRAQLLGDAGQRVGGPIYPVPETVGRPQRSPAVGALPDGRWLLVWEETVGSDFRVYHRLLEPDGTPNPQWPPREDHSESIIDPGSSPRPTLLTRAGDALVIWTDNRAGTSDVWGLWLDAEGNPQGAPALLRTRSDSARDSGVRAALAPDGRYVITWAASGASNDIPLARYFAADRSPLSDDLRLPDPAAGSLVRPGFAVALSDAAWVLIWTDDRSLSQQIYLRRVASDGSDIGGVVQGWTVPASASQFLPDVAMLPDGRAVVVWLDLRGGSLAVYGRLLDVEGKPLGQSFPINSEPVTRPFPGPTKAETYWENRPRVAASGIGTFLVIWASTPGGGARALVGQLYDAEAQPIGGNFLVTDPAGELDPQTDPWPAMGADGRFGVAWRNVVIQNQESNNEIYYQVFDPSGSRVGGRRNPVDRDARAADQLLPSLAISPFGEIVVSWIDRRGTEWEAYRQREAWDGTPLEPNNARMSEGGPVYGTATATNGGSIVVIWEDRYSTAGLIAGRLQILETKDAPAGAASPAEVVDFVVNDFDSPTGTKFPRVAMDSSGRFIVVWWDERNGQRRVWCRRYDASGNPLGPPYEIPAGEAASNRQYPAVAADLERIQFVWGDTRRGRGWDVLGRRVGWAYNGEPVPIRLQAFEARSERQGVRVRWQVPLSATASWFRLWRDQADAGNGPRPSARARLVTPDWLPGNPTGTFEVVDVAPPAGVPLAYYLESIEAGASEWLGPLAGQWDPPPARGWTAGPSPFRERIELRPPEPLPVRVEIWDVAGRRVRALARASASDAPLVWDGRDLRGREAPSGLYFVRLPGARAADGSAAVGAGAEVLRLIRLR